MVGSAGGASELWPRSAEAMSVAPCGEIIGAGGAGKASVPFCGGFLGLALPGWGLGRGGGGGGRGSGGAVAGAAAVAAGAAAVGAVVGSGAAVVASSAGAAAASAA